MTLFIEFEKQKIYARNFTNCKFHLTRVLAKYCSRKFHFPSTFFFDDSKFPDFEDRVRMREIFIELIDNPEKIEEFLDELYLKYENFEIKLTVKNSKKQFYIENTYFFDVIGSNKQIYEMLKNFFETETKRLAINGMIDSCDWRFSKGEGNKRNLEPFYTSVRDEINLQDHRDVETLLSIFGFPSENIKLFRWFHNRYLCLMNSSFSSKNQIQRLEIGIIRKISEFLF